MPYKDLNAQEKKMQEILDNTGENAENIKSRLDFIYRIKMMQKIGTIMTGLLPTSDPSESEEEAKESEEVQELIEMTAMKAFIMAMNEINDPVKIPNTFKSLHDCRSCGTKDRCPLVPLLHPKGLN